MGDDRSRAGGASRTRPRIRGHAVWPPAGVFASWRSFSSGRAPASRRARSTTPAFALAAAEGGVSHVAREQIQMEPELAEAAPEARHADAEARRDFALRQRY